MIYLQCHSCKAAFLIEDEFLGLELPCKFCSTSCTIPLEKPLKALYDKYFACKNALEKDRFQLRCPHCFKAYRLSSKVENCIVLCKYCQHLFIAHKYVEKEESNRIVIQVSEKPSENIPKNSKEKKEWSCSVCFCPIEPTDEIVECTECHLPFHKDCWEENYGCSAYGCSQQNILKKEENIRISLTDIFSSTSVPLPQEDGFPMESFILLLSVIFSLCNLYKILLPSLLLTCYIIVYLIVINKKIRQQNLVLIVLSFLLMFVSFFLGKEF